MRILWSYRRHTDHQPSNAGVLSTEVPFIALSNLNNSSLLWNYVTVPQAGLENRTLSYPRGRTLGGSSSVSKSCTPDLELFLMSDDD